MTNKFTLLIYNNPSNSIYNAYQFAKSSLEHSQELAHIFFWQDSVLIANKNITLAGDDVNLQKLWQELSKEYNLQLYICQASASRRGINHTNLAAQFTLGSIGMLAENLALEHNLISF